MFLKTLTTCSINCQILGQGRLGPYQLQSPGSSIRKEDESSLVVKDVSTVGACYRECRSNKDIACSSFSECTSSKKCVLSSKNINMGTHNDPEQARAIQNDTVDCTIYSVNYLSEFERLDGKTRKSGSLADSAGATAGDCAFKCRQTDLKTLDECRSFDFCPQSRKCFYYRTHYSWDGGDAALNAETNCDHYALRYSADYEAVGKGVYSGKPATKVLAVSFEECAKRCSELSNEDCKTISYCDSPVPNKEKQTCYMYAANIEDLGNDNNGENSCTLYTSKYPIRSFIPSLLWIFLNKINSAPIQLAEDATLVDEVISPRRQLERERRVFDVGMGDGQYPLLHNGDFIAYILKSKEIRSSTH